MGDMPVRRIFDECIVPCVTPEAALRGDDVREQRMYIEETDTVLRKHERVLSALYKHYFMRNPVMNKGKFGMEEWLAFLKEAKLISDDFTRREATLSFAWSRMRVADP